MEEYLERVEYLFGELKTPDTTRIDLLTCNTTAAIIRQLASQAAQNLWRNCQVGPTNKRAARTNKQPRGDKFNEGHPKTIIRR